jgi:Asp-tRNA(Asn)/Glu-tRNA(Gln) amidotransferase C subunit
MGLIMTRQEALTRIEVLEEDMRMLKKRVAAMVEMQEQLNEIDERTRQFKKFTQTSHPDFDLGA